MWAVSTFRLGSPIYLPNPALNAEWSFIYGSNDLEATVNATFVGRARELSELQVFLDRLTDSRAGDRPGKALLIRGAGASASPAGSRSFLSDPESPRCSTRHPRRHLSGN